MVQLLIVQNEIDELISLIDNGIVPLNREMIMDCIPWYDLNKKDEIMKRLNEIENKRSTRSIKSAKKESV